MNVFILLLDKDFNSGNGKSIGEVRIFEELSVQEKPSVADIFSMKRTYKKNVKWKNSGD